MSTSGLARPAQYLKIANATNRRAEFTNPRCLAKFWTSYTGKDKTARVIQYFARFMKWYLRLSNPDEADFLLAWLGGERADGTDSGGGETGEPMDTAGGAAAPPSSLAGA